ncbi:MAG TPA: malate dehydrogenase, partial [bacterium]|nr:malate dehydrogenase [bacterium]
TGQYGITDLYVGVPVKLGRQGVTEIIELKLDPKEHQELLNSAESYRKAIQELEGLI